MNQYILNDLSIYRYNILIKEHQILLRDYLALKKKTRNIHLLANAISHSPAIKQIMNTSNIGSWDLYNYQNLLKEADSLNI